MTAKPKGARGNREGKPWQRASDGRWVVRAWRPKGTIDADKPVYVYGKTQKEVKEKKEELEKQLRKGLPEDKDQTVAEYFSRWIGTTLPQAVAAGNMAASTLDSYRDNSEKHIVPILGHVKLADLSAPMVREWQHRLSEKPSGRVRQKLRKGETELPPPETLSPRTVAYCHAILRKAIADAINDDVAGLSDNVVRKVKPPRNRKRKEIQIPSVEELGRLLAVASEDEQLWCYWLVVLMLGLRRGEGLGMRWTDLDLEARLWTPGETVQRIRGEADPLTGRRKGSLVLKELKTEQDVRREALPIPVVAASALADWQSRQRKDRLAARVWLDTGLVFTTSRGTAYEPRNINRRWQKICEESGVTCRLHDLRHICGSYLIAGGANVKVVQSQLRHARQSTTQDFYIHMISETQWTAADVMDALYLKVSNSPARS